MGIPQLARVAAGVLVSLAFVTVLLVTGCGEADPYGSPLDGQGFGRPATTQSGAAATGGCVAKAITPSDPATLPTCCAKGQSGKARCVARDSVPPGVASQLDACTGGLCVPEPYVRDPNYVPKKCKAFNGTDGMCTSVCVPQVAQVAGILTVDICAADEKCAPCIDPRTQQRSGACDISTAAPVCGPGQSPQTPPKGTGPAAPAQCPYVGPPILDPNTMPPCGTAGGAHCMQRNLVPVAMQSQLALCGTGVCVPDDFIRAGGNFVPHACRSINDAEGRCIHQDIPEVAAQKNSLPISTCALYERCAPCFDPLTGMATTACHQSCDPGPHEPPRVFRGCCAQAGYYMGRCIPTNLIPPNQDKSYLDDEECGEGSGQYCVPAEMVPATFIPQRCQGSGLFGSYGGVCLSTCLDFGIESIALSQGTCDALHQCAPCQNPLDGTPTGAPGCP